ncbi:MAG: 2-hydroxyglutaryl-CoA dehydratase [Dehalococcoidia bacterium]|nr:2-hydroxyglutaryl-CoA dehydratase [Dehalococcoidia bacterium]
MKALGIDIGSLTTKVAILDSDNIVYSDITASADDSETSVQEAIDRALNQANLSLDDIYIVSTGVGSKFTSLCQQQKAITGCLARGIHYIFPSVRMAMDMGAETSTVIKINKRGRLSDWAGQEKCAAGTGIFLQQMSKLMQMPMEEMSRLSFLAKRRADISGTCAVFAESEVISHVHRVPPTPKEEVIAGIYASMVSRIMALCKRIGVEKDVAVSGGVALNTGLVNILEKELGFEVLVPDEPQIVAALGAAMTAKEQLEKGINN